MVLCIFLVFAYLFFVVFVGLLAAYEIFTSDDHYDDLSGKQKERKAFSAFMAENNFFFLLCHEFLGFHIFFYFILLFFCCCVVLHVFFVSSFYFYSLLNIIFHLELYILFAYCTVYVHFVPCFLHCESYKFHCLVV